MIVAEHHRRLFLKLWLGVGRAYVAELHLVALMEHYELERPFG